MQSPRSPPYPSQSDMGPDFHDLDFESEYHDPILQADANPRLFLSGNVSPFHSINRNYLPSLSVTATAGPQTSSRTSSSASSGSKRKASDSGSSRSPLTPGDTMMDEDPKIQDWKADSMMTGSNVPIYRSFNCSGPTPNGTIDPSKMSKNPFDFFTDISMDHDFDFGSAASSPGKFGNGQSFQMDSPQMPMIRHDKSIVGVAALNMQQRQHNANSRSVSNPVNGIPTNGSPQASPLSGMVTSQAPSVSGSSDSLSAGGVKYINGSILNAVSPGTVWPPQFSNNDGYQAAQLPAGHSSVPFLNQNDVGRLPANSACKYRLIIHPIPTKSRVETQIPIKVTLCPMPPGITKLHLPKHTISKPKLLSKPPPEKSPDMLELSTMLVCTTAMQNPEKRRRALARAARGPDVNCKSSDSQNMEDTAEGPDVDYKSPHYQNMEVTADDDDENKPVNGGEVQICGGCIIRERKRAARKKVKKAEDEEAWHRDESKRVIVFNANEVKEWQAPTSQPPSEATGERAEPEPMVPEGAMQIDAPMRIACYCRHQGERFGFRVIFTIKDHLGRLIAQEMTSSISITDDHKTHNMPPMLGQDPNGSDGHDFPTQGLHPTDPAYSTMMAAPANGTNYFGMSRSSSDLQTLRQQQYQAQYQQVTNTKTTSIRPQSTPVSMTTRNLSGQASPSTSIGPSSKKRKASGSISKVPTGLAMTKMEHSQTTHTFPTALPSAAASSAASPFTPAFGSFHPSPEHQFKPLPNHPSSQQFNTGPPTPNSNDNPMFPIVNRSISMENMARYPMYSAPVSAHPSRAPSPNGLRQQAIHSEQEARLAQAIANGFFGLPLPLNPHRPPTIHKLIPYEGPTRGGIEVTCLGSGFCQGLEVMFGDNKATTTTFWGETSLVCLLPPAACAGTVSVTFKHQHQQQVPQFPTPTTIKQSALFKYIDDDEQQIIKQALGVLNHKMTGKMEDVREIARRIINDDTSSWISNGQNGDGSQSQHGTNFGTSQFDVDPKDVEGSLLRILDLIDLDDNPRVSRLNYKTPSGQTMLHLACSLGFHRFVAALLARGANPLPRDKSGFTPMHFAALHNHAQIVRRLILSGADPTMRSLLGYTPADLATSEEVLCATRRVENHSRTRSNCSTRSRTGSVASLKSLWEPPPRILARVLQSTSDSSDDGSGDVNDDDEYQENVDNEDANAISNDGVWRRSSRSELSRADPRAISNESSRLDESEAHSTPGLPSPTAAMAAFRDQTASYLQHIQQSMFPNLPIQMPTLPDYQAYLPGNPMVKRISLMVPHRALQQSSGDGKEHDHKWWEFFSNSGPTAPPAYDEIFPDKNMEAGRSSAAQAACDAIADNKCAVLFDQTQGQTETLVAVAGSSTTLETVKQPLNAERHSGLSLARTEHLTRLKSDRKLFFIWIPLLVVIILAMCYNRVPQVASFLRNRYTDQGCLIDVQ